MPLKPDSEKPELGAPGDYQAHHPEEHPAMWGWHGEWGRTARIAGVVVAIFMLLMITSTQYNHQGTMWLIITAVGLLVGVGWDIYRTKNAWRR